MTGGMVCLAHWMGEFGNSKEDGNPIKSPQIEANTAKTAFWTKVVGVPVLIGLILGALAGLTKC